MADLATRVRNYERQGQTNLRIKSITTTDSEEIYHIPSKTILNQVRAATTLAGEERLGLRADCIGTHSIRSGAAMAMHLAGIPSEMIQLVGRWRGQIFMRYLQIQVPDSTIGLAARMTNRQTFFTIAPDTVDEQQPENGGNQVNPQQRDGPPHDNNRTRRERQNY